MKDSLFEPVLRSNGDGDVPGAQTDDAAGGPCAKLGPRGERVRGPMRDLLAAEPHAARPIIPQGGRAQFSLSLTPWALKGHVVRQ